MNNNYENIIDDLSERLFNDIVETTENPEEDVGDESPRPTTSIPKGVAISAAKSISDKLDEEGRTLSPTGESKLEEAIKTSVEEVNNSTIELNLFDAIKAELEYERFYSDTDNFDDPSTASSPDDESDDYEAVVSPVKSTGSEVVLKSDLKRILRENNASLQESFADIVSKLVKPGTPEEDSLPEESVSVTKTQKRPRVEVEDPSKIDTIDDLGGTPEEVHNNYFDQGSTNFDYSKFLNSIGGSND